MRAVVFASVLSASVGLRKRQQQSTRSELRASRYFADVPVFEILSEKALKDEWLVFFKDGGDDSAIESFCGQGGVACKIMGHASRGVPFVTMHGSEEALATALRGSKGVDFVAPDYALEPDIDPSPEDAAKAEAEAKVGVLAASNSWGLDRIGVPRAEATGKGVNVYVFDSGVRTSHAEFEKRAIPTLEWDSEDGQTVECDPSDRFCADDYMGHGTHVAGIVAGREYGVAPDATIRAMLMNFSTADRGVSVAYANFDWLIRNRQLPAVLQMSFGWPQQVPGSLEAINRVVAAGITVVVASGNSRTDTCGFTWGWVPGVISVAASDSRDGSASFTNYGKCITLYAPGVAIYSANGSWKGGVVSKSGTSMAAPMVSGAVALLLERNPELSPAEVKASLIENALEDVLKNVPSGTPNLLLQVAPASGA